MMIKLAAKFGPKLPGLLARAAIGDPTAIATLAAVGGLAFYAWLSSQK